MVKGQTILVKSTGTRYRLDQIEKQRDGNALQFYPVVSENDQYPRGSALPFKLSEHHFQQLVKRLLILIEPIENGSTRRNTGKPA